MLAKTGTLSMYIIWKRAILNMYKRFMLIFSKGILENLLMTESMDSL